MANAQFTINDLALQPGRHIDARNAGAAANAATDFSAERLEGNLWDSRVSEFDGVCQEQLFAFATKRWPGVKCEPLIFTRNGKDVAAVLVMVQRLPLGLASIAVIKWGPMLADEYGPDAGAIYSALVDWLTGHYCNGRRMMLSILPRAMVGPRTYEFETLRDVGFQPGSQLLFPNRYLVNVRLDDDALRASFGQKWRYHLKKAEKNNLTCEHVPQTEFDAFDALYRVMTDRKRFPDHSAFETVATLMEMPDKALRPELFYVREGGEIVAGAVIFKAGSTAVYLYGATNDRALPLLAGYYLHWEIIRWLRDNTKANWYDLGGTDGFQGLHQFKKGMAGSEGAIDPVPPVMNIATHWQARLFGEIAFAAREVAQRFQRWRERKSPDFAKPDQER